MGCISSKKATDIILNASTIKEEVTMMVVVMVVVMMTLCVCGSDGI